ncbi:hypothetical protein BDP27DRAFT_1428194 [Rhodocollybia butyracea]|uniref:Uncharacterized protein n=1 Tax=Rhodocollybia butyracea TaxID=206335 RepID=A0A9P5PAU9_9AGAR|nr:hypothetical protein BDP27DRAFT_1428194 [Rhodocollybia butyracea]
MDENAIDPNGFYLFGLSSLSSSTSSPPTLPTRNTKTDTDLLVLSTFGYSKPSCGATLYDAFNTWSDDGFETLDSDSLENEANYNEVDSRSESSDSPDAHSKTSLEVLSALQRGEALAASRAAKATAYTRVWM